MKPLKVSKILPVKDLLIAYPPSMEIDYILGMDLVRISGQLHDGECLTHVQQDRNIQGQSDLLILERDNLGSLQLIFVSLVNFIFVILVARDEIKIN